MKFVITILSLLSSYSASLGQTANGMTGSHSYGPLNGEIVANHKELVNIVLIIDSVTRGGKTFKLKWRRELEVKNESDYLQVANDIYIKIFLSRNEEYGKKFYSWKWDFLQKTGSKYSRLGSSGYDGVLYNSVSELNGSSSGLGIGTESDPDYLMIHYRSKLN